MIDDNDGGSTPVVARNWVGSAVTTDSQPRQWAKRMLCGTPSVDFRAERLKTLRPRVDDKVVISSGLSHPAWRVEFSQPKPLKSWNVYQMN